MSDRDWTRRRDDRDTFQERGYGANPDRFPPVRNDRIDDRRDDRNDPRQGDSWRGHGDAPAQRRAREDERGWDQPHRHDDLSRDRNPGYRDADYRDLGRNRDDHLHGQSGRGYGGLSRRDYDERGPGRVFDRGEDYGRGDTDSRGRAGQGSYDPASDDRRRDRR